MINYLILSTLLSLSGAQNIELGEEELQKGNWERAIFFFKEALSSDLGPPANAACYWSMYIAYDQLNKPDDAADSLFMFVGTVEFFNEFLSEAPVGHPGFIWYSRAGIKDKTLYAKAILDVYWMRKNNYYCRNELYSCSIPFQKMVGLYATKLPFCKGKGMTNVRIVRESPKLIIGADCLGGSTEEYYFSVQNEKGLQ